MKTFLYFVSSFIFFSYSSFAQTHTWTGNGDNYFWSDSDNWDQGTIPLLNGVGTVIIPEGVEVHSTSEINFEYGEFTGGGTLINNGVINLINDSETETLKVFSNITIMSQADTNIYRSNGILNNDPIILNEGAVFFTGHNGTFTLNGIGISFTSDLPGFLNINGDFTKTGIEDVVIDVEMKICCYDFTVSEGLLLIEPATSNIILGPFFDIHQDASLILKGNHIFAGNGGSVNGNIEGYLEITNGPVDTPLITGSFFFDAEGILTLKNVTFQGNGFFHCRVNVNLPESSTLTIDGPRFSNQEIFTTYSNSSIFLKNEGRFSNSDTLIIEGDSSISGLNNELFNNGGLVQILNNSSFEISNINLTNSNTIDIKQGDFILNDDSSFENYYYFDDYGGWGEYYGEVLGSGTFKFPSYNPQTVNNNAIFSPEPGVTSINTINFSQNSTGFIKIDIDNLTSFDTVINTGTTFFEGDFEVNLNFTPDIGDEFIVFQTGTEISNCSPELTTSTEYNNNTFIFDVICNPNNITLKLVEILAIEDYNLTDYNFYIYPNPVSETAIFNISINDIDNPSVYIYNILGQNVYQMEIIRNSQPKFIRNNLPNGVYFAQLKSNSKLLAVTKMVLK